MRIKRIPIPEDEGMTEEEHEFLYRLAKDLEPGSTILEIGCTKGASTHALSKGARESRSNVYSVISMSSLPIKDLENLFWRLRFPNTHILPGDFASIDWKNSTPINLFYVNDHNGSVADYVFWEPNFTKDATVVYNNYNNPRKGSEVISREVDGLIKKVQGKGVQKQGKIKSFWLPGKLDDYYEKQGFKLNPFTRRRFSIEEEAREYKIPESRTIPLSSSES